MSYPHSVHLLWAKSEAEAIALQELGWRFAVQRPTHHHFYACLMRWEGKGEPRMIDTKISGTED